MVLADVAHGRHLHRDHLAGVGAGEAEALVVVGRRRRRNGTVSVWLRLPSLELHTEACHTAWRFILN